LKIFVACWEIYPCPIRHPIKKTTPEKRMTTKTFPEPYTKNPKNTKNGHPIPGNRLFCPRFYGDAVRNPFPEDSTRAGHSLAWWFHMLWIPYASYPARAFSGTALSIIGPTIFTRYRDETPSPYLTMGPGVNVDSGVADGLLWRVSG
jgi:hypothetical protein